MKNYFTMFYMTYITIERTFLINYPILKRNKSDPFITVGVYI